MPITMFAQTTPNWDPQDNGYEDTYMQFSADWKREIVAWAKDCIYEIKNKIFQLDQINWAASDDIRFQIGQTIGRILELHRQQEDMYRRLKRRMENRFNWIRPELAIKIPQLPVDGYAEPQHDKPYPGQDFGYPGYKVNQTHVDYKPHVYIIALEFVTKRESDIEHLVKLITNYMGEEEVGRFKPNWLPAGEDGPAVWAGFSTYGYSHVRRQGAVEREEAAAERKEEQFKAKMRAEYYRKRNRKH